MWTKFASKPRPQKFSLSKVYNSLNFWTKCIEIPHCCKAFYSFWVRWRKIWLVCLKKYLKKINHIDSARCSFIGCNTGPNYSRCRLSSCSKKLGADCILPGKDAVKLISSKRALNHRGGRLRIGLYIFLFGRTESQWILFTTIPTIFARTLALMG